MFGMEKTLVIFSYPPSQCPVPFPFGHLPQPLLLLKSLRFHPSNSFITLAKRKGTSVQPLFKQSPAVDNEELEADEGVEAEADELVLEDSHEEILEDDIDDYMEEYIEDDDDAKLFAGDGGEGGGISLAGTWWDKKALEIAEQVSLSFNGDLKIYAFKTTLNATIRIRIEKLSTKYGSPSMADIEAFTSAYRERLDEAEITKDVPENLSLEVSSPGVERVIQIPKELERFKEKPMHVRYRTLNNEEASAEESEGIFRLISYDLELCHCVWGIADVKANRKQAGKGRPLNKKQREWRLQTSFDSLILVRVHSDC